MNRDEYFPVLVYSKNHKSYNYEEKQPFPVKKVNVSHLSKHFQTWIYNFMICTKSGANNALPKMAKYQCMHIKANGIIGIFNGVTTLTLFTSVPSSTTW